MHWLYTELIREPERGKVKVAVYKPVETEFGRAVFPGLMLHHFLPYF